MKNYIFLVTIEVESGGCNFIKASMEEFRVENAHHISSFSSDTLSFSENVMSGVEQSRPHEVVHHVARVVRVIGATVQVVFDQLVLHANVHV